MRPVTFTTESIIDAGRELQTAGRSITGFALRAKVGGGNPSRLKQVWDEHINSQTTTAAEPVAELPVEVAEVIAVVSKELTERLAALAVDLNDKTVKAAERRVHEVVRSAGEQRAQAERELADAAQAVDDLESELDKASAHGVELEARLAEVQTTSQAQAVELAQLRERLSVNERAAAQAVDQHADAVERMTAQHASEVARMNSAIEAERARHQQEIDQIRSQLAEQKRAGAADLAEQKAFALAVSTELDQVRTKLATVRAGAEAAERTHQERCKAFEHDVAQVAERLAKAEASQALAVDDARSAREAAAGLRGQLEATQTQAAELLRVVGLARAGDPVAGADLTESTAGSKKKSAATPPKKGG